jgi:hypothetical protein
VRWNNGFGRIVPERLVMVAPSACNPAGTTSGVRAAKCDGWPTSVTTPSWEWKTRPIVAAEPRTCSS